MDYALRDLITNYHEINASIIDELHEEPSALGFMRYVAKNRPFVVRRAAYSWPAVKKWNAEYLNNIMAGKSVQVAITPHGNADAVVQQEDQSLLFVQPHETFEPFSDFLAYVQQDSKPPSDQTKNARNVKYAQTQNDNLRAEYLSLFADVPADIPFARIALQKSPDAVNLWIGNECSVTALHKDNYENIYVQVKGEKHFVLLSPIEMPCLHEQMLRRGRYAPSSRSPSQPEDCELVIERDGDEDGDDGDEKWTAAAIPVATWDPDCPEERATPYSHLAEPLRVTLREGDMLYLPAMWYHKVSQSVGEEGFACAVNWWYDMEFTGPAWTMNNFVRDVANAERNRKAQDA